MKSKKKKWIRFRHRIVTFLAYWAIMPYCRIKYGIKPERFRKKGDKRAYLILLNHQTPFDQFFVGISFFQDPVYYLATEDIFSLGWVSKLIRWIVAPIPIKKQTTDAAAVMTLLRVAREGGSIAIAPEGNRTYSGKTEYMSPTIAGLARKMKLPIALYRIEGGYGVQPRWSDGTRKGKMRAYVSEVIEPEEYQNLTNDELFERIEKGLYINEAVSDSHFFSEKRAEYLERAIYVCPYCGLTKFESKGNETTCKSCGRKIHYTTDKQLQGVGFDFPFRFVNDWYEYQKDYVNSLELESWLEKPMFQDYAKLTQVIVYQKKVPLRSNAHICLYSDRVVIDEGTDSELLLPFSQVTAVSVLGRNKLNIYIGDDVYQFKGDAHFNALKYVNIFYRYKNISRGEPDGKFLGL